MKSVPKQPVAKMTPVLSAVSFTMWEIDLAGQFVKPSTKYKHGAVVVDYFSKWVEAIPLRNTTAEEIEDFIWKNIIIRYGIPKILVLDNGPKFDASVIRDMCKRLGLNIDSPSMLPSGEWKTPSNVTGETPFSLVFETEDVLPVEVCLSNIRQISFDEETNEERMKESLDFTYELRDQALYRMQRYKHMTARFNNRRVKIRQFSVGNLVLRLYKASKPKKQENLNPKWEGPYRIRRVICPGTYELEELSGKTIKHIWHKIYMKKYYVYKVFS
ncbi:hypothetical protein LIER_00230 [Lithospermum erythrorhizon]|uniref:Integrase catalytic domain-containing protein n=1 Tax=Lithospermum erythrorhizon TaxID=34254 RepID=A0AAV3NI58_LITER